MTSVCQICGDSVGVAVDGEPFIACGHCNYPVCRPCYEYERKEGGKACPNCKTFYKRHKGSPRIEADDEEDEEDGGDEQPADWRYRSSLYQSDPSPPPPAAGTLHQSQPSMDDAQNLGYGASPIHENSAYRRSQMDNDSASDYNEHLGMPVGSTSPQVGPRNAIVPSGPGFGTFGNSASQAPAEWLAQSGSETPAVRALDPKKDPTEYGYGSVVWKGRTVASADGMEAGAGGAGNYAYGGMGADGSPTQDQDGDLPTMDEARQPLSRKVHLKSELISPYRLVIVMRFVITVLFLRWRIINPVWDAYGLWLVSIICEVWFFFSWILDQFPKWNPIRRETYMDRLSLRFEKPNEDSQLAAVDLFVSTVDPMKEPPLTTANTLLSILAVDYPVEKVACYLSDDGGSMLTFDMMGETAEFARIWVPFCKKYNIEPRAPDVYFIQKVDFLKDKLDTSFVLERRSVKRQYEEFKVRINALCARFQNVPADGWTMQDGTPWPGNKSRDHPGMIQVFLGPNGGAGSDGMPLPRLVYVSREKRPGYNHHKKAGAMNSLVRVAAVLTNAPYILNLDCDHYINNSRALREAMCFMMDPNVGRRACYVQFPQRFDGIDPSDRYANNNTVFFDINLPGLDGVQGPVYVGTGCCFRRHALYGFDPPKKEKKSRNGICALCHCIFCCGGCGGRKQKKAAELQALAEGGGLSDGKSKGKGKGRKGKGKSGRMERIAEGREEVAAMAMNAMGMGIDDVEGMTEEDEKGSLMALKKFEKRFGASPVFVLSTFHEEGGGVAFTGPGSTLKEAIHVISCGYEEGTDWGKEIGWIYGSVTEDILTGFKMQCRGWRSIYCQPKRVAFKGSAPINLSDRLQQVLRWALGSIEIFLSRHCPIWYGWKANRLKVLQRLAYANTAVYPFTSFPLLAYCMLPAICLFTGKFIIPGLTTTATLYFVGLFAAIIATYVLELRWSGVGLTELWRNEQFWVIGGVSAHLFAVFQGLLKVLAGIDTNFTVTAKQADDGEFAELYMVKWTTLLIPPMFLIIINVLGIISGLAQAMNMGTVGWGTMFGKIFFSLWVILHLYPFLKGMSGRNKRVPTLVIVWSILLASVFSLLWADINPWGEQATGPTAEECGIRC